jgi:WD40 repeat protein/serine/threonine protein kinase
MAADADSARAIFLEALDKSSPSERLAFVAEACGKDDSLRQRVDALLRAHDTPFNMLDRPALERVPLTSRRGASDPAVSATQAPAAAASEALAIVGPATRDGSLGRLAHYELLEVRGLGGFGTVYRSFDDKLHRIVAIKVLSPLLAASSTARQRFLREARLAAAVRHEHVVDIHAVEELPVPYLVMEYIDGQTLQQKVDKGGPLPVQDIVRIGYQVAAGLAAAHRQGLIHRDIKPSNILLEHHGERVKLSDFGMARAVDDASLTTTGQLTGTPMYMSPEQAESRAVDHRSDLFSLGSVLYTVCTGQAPFRAATGWAVLKCVCNDTPRPIRECNPDIPEWLAKIVTRLLAKPPEERYANAQVVAERFARYLHDLQIYGEVHLTPLPGRPPEAVHPASVARASAPDITPAIVSSAALTSEDSATLLTPNRPRPRRRLRRLLGLAAALAAAVVGVVWIGWYLGAHDAPVVEETAPATPEPVVAKPSRPVKPFAQWARSDIPADLLSLVGNPDDVPAELVAVLGDVRFMLTGGRVGAMATNRKGQLLAAGSGTELLFFDVRTGRQVRRILGHPAPITHVAFANHGGRVVTGCDDAIARLWDVETGKLLASFEGHTGAVLAACFTSDDRTLITGSADGTAAVWDVASYSMLKHLVHPEHVLGVALSPDDRTLGTACRDGQVRIWDRTADYEIRGTLTGHGSDAPAVAFSPDGRRVITGGHKVKVWEAGSLKPVYTLPERSNWLGFGAGGRDLLASGIQYARGEKYVVTRWDLATGKKLPAPTLDSAGGIAAFTMSPDGKTLYAVRTRRGPRFVRAYAIDTGKLQFPKNPQGHRAQVTAVAFSPAGDLLASGSLDHGVRLWHVASRPEGEALPPMESLSGHTDAIYSVQFSPDGKLLASGSSDRTIVLWDVATGKPLRTLDGHSGLPSRLAFSPDGSTIAAGLDNGAVRFWDVASGNEKQLLAGHAGAVAAVAYSPDGKLLVSASADKTLRVRDPVSGERVDRFDLTGRPLAVAFTADGKRLVATTEHDGRSTLDVWDVATWQRTEYPSHSAPAPALALNPTAPLVATGSTDGTVRLWDFSESVPRPLTLASGVCGEDGPADMAFTHDGRHLATANPNGTVTIFRIPSSIQERAR